MPNFIPNNYRQEIMIALNFEDQLQPGTFEYALHHLIENKLDLSIFYPRYKNEEMGRPAYDPAVLLKNRTVCLLQRHHLQSGNPMVLPKQPHLQSTRLRQRTALHHPRTLHQQQTR